MESEMINFSLFIVLVLANMTQLSNQHDIIIVSEESFGDNVDGKPVKIYTLKNITGMTVRITNYGAIVQSLIVPDKNGIMEDVVLGYDKLEDYLKDSPYFGAIVGRYGNRIKKGKFSLNGKDYTLAKNNAPNHLHGGLKGFDKVVWDAEAIEGESAQSLKLTYLSKDGEEGYPGNLKAIVIYSLTDENELSIEYFAETDKNTPVNLTHHGYFNLSGNCKADILNHKLWINADRFTPVDSTLIPTGELCQVKGTAFDFTTAMSVGARVNND
jgi:aldose 1-epimerase